MRVSIAARVSSMPMGSPVPHPWNFRILGPFFMAAARSIRFPHDFP